MIGIIGAMEQEVAKLIGEMKVEAIIQQASMKFCQGILCGKEVVVVQSGIGKVNAAACAQILIDKFQVTTLINTGIAGSLDARIDIGDMVISTDALNHDMDVSIFGYGLGQIPGLEVLSFPADTVLVEKAYAANQKANPEIKTYRGRVVTGDQFVASPELKDKLVSEFQGMCAEMEGAAIAQVAYLNQVSYVIIRAISDKADNSATVDYPEFEEKAILHSVKLVEQLLPNL